MLVDKMPNVHLPRWEYTLANTVVHTCLKLNACSLNVSCYCVLQL